MRAEEGALVQEVRKKDQGAMRTGASLVVPDSGRNPSMPDGMTIAGRVAPGGARRLGTAHEIMQSLMLDASRACMQ